MLVRLLEPKNGVLLWSPYIQGGYWRQLSSLLVSHMYYMVSWYASDYKFPLTLSLPWTVLYAVSLIALTNNNRHHSQWADSLSLGCVPTLTQLVISSVPRIVHLCFLSHNLWLRAPVTFQLKNLKWGYDHKNMVMLCYDHKIFMTIWPVMTIKIFKLSLSGFQFPW